MTLLGTSLWFHNFNYRHMCKILIITITNVKCTGYFSTHIFSIKPFWLGQHKSLKMQILSLPLPKPSADLSS